MLIDWFTVGAQALNFLILVWLLKRFLYKPILHALDARESRIAKELADADAQREDARQERDAFQHKNAEFDRQRAALMSTASTEAKAERHRLIDDARRDAEHLRATQREAWQRDQQALNDDMIRRAQREVFAITGKTLTDLAGTSLEARMCEMFARRVRALEGEPKEQLAAALATASEPPLVRSAFDLPAESRAAIQQAIEETFAATPVRFETAPDLIGGVELTVNGQKVAWSIADYLASLEKGIRDLLADSNPPEAKLAPEKKGS